MKYLSIAAISLLLATCAASECTVVEVVDFRSSSQFVQITVLKYRRGVGDKLHPMNTKTDDRGHFSAALNPGIYTAVLGAPGFQTEVIVFEIAPDGNKEDLRVELKVGSC